MGVPFPGVKRPGREADHSLPSSAEIKMRGAITHSPNTPSWRGDQLNTGTNLHLSLTLHLLVILMRSFLWKG